MTSQFAEISALLQTKLYRPPASPDLEPRARLLDQLQRNFHRPITLITAPAGSGKSQFAVEMVVCATSNHWG